MFSSANPWLPSGHPPPPALGMGTRSQDQPLPLLLASTNAGHSGTMQVPAILPQNRNIDAAASYRTTARGLVKYYEIHFLKIFSS